MSGNDTKCLAGPGRTGVIGDHPLLVSLPRLVIFVQLPEIDWNLAA
jgi:hypothetical protein